MKVYRKRMGSVWEAYGKRMEAYGSVWEAFGKGMGSILERLKAFESV